MVFKIIFLLKSTIKLQEILEKGHCKIKTLTLFFLFQYIFFLFGNEMIIVLTKTYHCKVKVSKSHNNIVWTSIKTTSFLEVKWVWLKNLVSTILFLDMIGETFDNFVNKVLYFWIENLH